MGMAWGGSLQRCGEYIVPLCVGLVLCGCKGTCFWSDELACQLRIESGVDELLQHHVDVEGARRYVHLHANFNHRYDQEAACLLETVSRISTAVLFVTCSTVWI